MKLTVWAHSEFVDPFVNIFESIFVGEIEAIDDPHHTSIKEFTQRFVLRFASCVPKQNITHFVNEEIDAKSKRQIFFMFDNYFDRLVVQI